MSSALLTLLLLSPVPAADNQRTNMLVDVPELIKSVKSEETASVFRVIDTRSQKDYEAGHIPFSIRVDVSAWSNDLGTGKDEENLRKRAAKSRIDQDSRVIVYGDDAREYCRLWWLLRYLGVADVRILNGGWKAWQDAKGPIDSGDAKFNVKIPKEIESLQSGRLATKSQLLEGLKDKRFQIIDARSDKEFCGEMKTAKRSGSIPGAIHLEWSDLLDSKTQRFKSQDELSKLFENAGIDINKPSVTYCQSGGRASVMAFGLELVGAKNVRNYYKSWAEWGNAEDTPIETPKPKSR